MQLLVIRHAIAEDRDEFAESGQPDDQRPLTKDGIRKMKKAAQGLKEIVGQINHLATSPLTRAAQTAEIVGDVLETGGADVIPALVPDARPEDFVAWCEAHHDKNVIAIVGHEPHLSSLIMWLVAGRGDSRVELKKGGACLIDFESTPAAGAGTLRWLATPRMLRKLGS